MPKKKNEYFNYLNNRPIDDKEKVDHTVLVDRTIKYPSIIEIINSYVNGKLSYSDVFNEKQTYDDYDDDDFLADKEEVENEKREEASFVANSKDVTKTSNVKSRDVGIDEEIKINDVKVEAKKEN